MPSAVLVDLGMPFCHMRMKCVKKGVHHKFIMQCSFLPIMPRTGEFETAKLLTAELIGLSSCAELYTSYFSSCLAACSSVFSSGAA